MAVIGIGSPTASDDMHIMMTAGSIPLRSVFGYGACLAATLLSHRGWQTRRLNRISAFLACGATLLAAAILLAAQRGVATGLIELILAVTLSGIGIILFTAERKPARAARALRSEGKGFPDRRRIAQAWQRSCLGLILALLATEAVCAAIAALLPMIPVASFSTAMIVSPLLWAALATWAFSDPVWKRPALGMAGMMTIGAAVAMASIYL